MKDKALRIGRAILGAIGGATIFAGFFFGSLFVLDYLYLKYPDSVRRTDAISLKAALERYRSARGTYPFPFIGTPVTDLKEALVDGKYLDAIPVDPVLGTKTYRYASVDGKTYGLLFILQFPTENIPAGGPCMTGIGATGTGWWGEPPQCPF